MRTSFRSENYEPPKAPGGMKPIPVFESYEGVIMLQAPYPALDDLLKMMGEAGKRLSDIEASEGSAGNISIFLHWPIELSTHFPLVENFDLPQPVPELSGATFLVSGSGSRLREIIDEPIASIGCIVWMKEGRRENCLHLANAALNV